MEIVFWLHALMSQTLEWILIHHLFEWKHAADIFYIRVLPIDWWTF